MNVSAVNMLQSGPSHLSATPRVRAPQGEVIAPASETDRRMAGVWARSHATSQLMRTSEDTADSGRVSIRSRGPAMETYEAVHTIRDGVARRASLSDELIDAVMKRREDTLGTVDGGPGSFEALAANLSKGRMSLTTNSPVVGQLLSVWA